MTHDEPDVADAVSVDGADDHGAPERPVSPTPPVLDSQISPRILRRRLAMADVAAFGVGIAFTMLVQAQLRPVPDRTMWGQILLVVCSLPIWLMLVFSLNLYVSRVVARPAEEMRRITLAAVMWAASLAGLAFAVNFDKLSRSWVLMALCAVWVAHALERTIARAIFGRLRRSGRMARPILIAGTDASAADLARRLRRMPHLGYRAVGFVGDHVAGDELDGLPVLGGFDDTERVAAESGAGGVMVSLSSVDGPTVNALSRRLTEAGLHVSLTSSLSDIDLRRLRFQEVDRQTLIYIEPVIRTGWRMAAKRAFDVGGALLGLALSSPILLAAAIAIKIDSPGPVFYRQRRTGQHGQPFEILKLRTMVVDAHERRAELDELNESDGPLFKIKKDPRITRVGRFLRATSIDEIPQFWNVVRGEMSIVGPRPALPSEVEQWDADVHERLRVLPGITGLWQVSGRADTDFEQYKRLDLYYVDNWSLFHDIEVVLRTVGVIATRRGAS